MAFGNTAPDKVLGDSFLRCDLFHLICHDAALGISNDTHTISVQQKDKIKTRFCISG
jgi:hypothetical protein